MEDEKLKVENEKKVSEAALKRFELPRRHRKSLKSYSELRRKSRWPKCGGYHYDAQDVTMCSPSSGADSDQSQLMRISKRPQAEKMSVKTRKREVEESNRDSSRRGRTAEFDEQDSESEGVFG